MTTILDPQLLIPLTTYASLFGISFGAATVLPLQSEAVLSGLLLTTNHAPWLLVLVASTGNTLGAVVNWALGRKIEQYHDRSWFPAGPKALTRAKKWYERYGRWSLLLSWLPLVGDALTVASGVLKERLIIFVPIVALAKTGRYVVLCLLIS